MLGHRLNDFNMYALVDLTAGQTMSGMAELARRRVLRDGSQGLEFVNEMVRAAAYMGVPVTLRKVLHGKIADRLVEEHSRGDHSLGLQVAWHCIRAGRGHEATPYLLNGARYAIARGALHEAEYSLSTALPHLGGSVRAEAILLLVEVLQDQGRWQESVSPLQEPVLSESADLASVFLLTAEHRITHWPVQRILSDVLRLQQIIQCAMDVPTRVRAVKAAAHLLADLRDESFSMQLLKSAESIPVDKLRQEYMDELEISKAQLLYQGSEHSASLSRMLRLVVRLESSGTATSMLGNLYCGLGAIYCGLGRYADAHRESLKGYEVGSRLANDTTRAAMSAQLALCCGRLGDYKGQLTWSNTALKTFGASFGGYCELQAGYCASFAYAMTNNPRQAAETISRVRARVPDAAPPWLKQASLLYEADIWHLTGHTEIAVARAREALDYKSLTPHSAAFVGPFTRWLAMASQSLEERRKAEIWLDSTLAAIERHDALDQVEVLCACIHMDRSYPGTTLDVQRMLREKLGELPSSINEQLKRLGFQF
jgi:hypothetical protein